MKCFSLVANGFIATAGLGVHGGGAVYVVDAYPRAVPGFELDPTDRALKVGFVERLPASDELLTLSPDSSAISRDGKQVKVLRASVKNDGGKQVLIPEQPSDDTDALVYIDVGSGHHSFIRFTASHEQVVAHSRADGEDGHERILVRLKPFEPVTALRSDKKWIFWGEERVRETLTIRFDGANVFYDIQRVGKKK